MKQIGLEPGWLHFLQQYVQPLQQRVYEGYWNDVRICFVLVFANVPFVTVEDVFVLFGLFCDFNP